MKLTNESKTLINFIMKNNIQNGINKSTNKKCLQQLYELFADAFEYIGALKKSPFFTVEEVKVNNFKQIPKPMTFPASSFHPEIKQYIDSNIVSYYKYTLVPLFNRNIVIYFIVSKNERISKQMLNNYIEYLLVWLYILNEISLSTCSESLTIYFYITSLKKQLPNGHKTILDEKHVNTAFTRTCAKNAEIVIFRKEEWFKVFIHETMHSFGLDFSGLNVTQCNKIMLSTFHVKSDVNLYESYTEFWARIINICFCSFLINDNKNISFNIFYKNFNELLGIEVAYSCYQMVKVLNYIGINYVSLIEDKLTKNKYNEKTSVLSYYIITFILMFNANSFLTWCNTNNTDLILFTQTQENIMKFCQFIKTHYKKTDLLYYIFNMEELFGKLNDGNSTFLQKNLRMTSCELG